MNQLGVSARECRNFCVSNVELIEDAAEDLENASEEIMTPGHTGPRGAAPTSLMALPSASAAGS
jgi:hypothetical protein